MCIETLYLVARLFIVVLTHTPAARRCNGSNVVHVCIFICYLGTSNLALTVLKGPLEALAGVVYGILLGILFWYLPDSKTVSQ